MLLRTLKLHEVLELDQVRGVGRGEEDLAVRSNSGLMIKLHLIARQLDSTGYVITSNTESWKESTTIRRQLE